MVDKPSTSYVEVRDTLTVFSTYLVRPLSDKLYIASGGVAMTLSFVSAKLTKRNLPLRFTSIVFIALAFVVVAVFMIVIKSTCKQTLVLVSG